MNLFHNLSVRQKLILPFSILIFGLSLFIFIYFPARREKILILSIEEKAKVIGKMTAFSISPELFFNDTASSEETIINAKQNKELLYLVAEKNDEQSPDRKEVFANFNFTKALETKYKETVTDFDAGVTKSQVPIYHKDKIIGTLYIGLSLEEVKQEIFAIRYTLSIISLIIFAVGIFVVSAISSFITKPLNRFVNTIKDIDYQSLDKRIKIHTTDEIGQLAKRFNEMLEKLQSVYAELDKLNKTLEQRVIERTKDLKQSEERFKLLYNETPIMLNSINRDGVLVSVSDYWLKSLGYERNEAIGRKITDFYTDESKEYAVKVVQPQFFKTGFCKDISYKMIKKNGEIIDVLLSATSEKDSEGNVLRSLAILMDVTEKNKVIDELVKAKEEVEKSDKLKSEFLAQMSHEIRSPLNVTISFANLIKDELGNLLTPELSEYIEGIEMAGNRLIRTVDLILNASQMQVGTYEAILENINLFDDILMKIKAEYLTQTEKKHLNFIFSCKTSNPYVYGDEYSINQIFVNLIDNAVKYTNKGKIEVTIDRDDRDKIRVTIEDTGIGISKEFMHKLFDPFMQEERGYSRIYEGNGLGLSLVKKYCDLNNASINVESEKNIGSKFIVIFSM